MRNDEQATRYAQERAGDLLAIKLVRLANQSKATRSTGFKIPELEADPDVDDPTNLWLFADGRLKTRTLDGEVHEYHPYETPAPNRPPIPTFAADPAAGTGWKLWFNGGTGELRGRLANGNVVVYAPFTPDSSTDGGDPPDPPAPPPVSTKPKPPDPRPKKYTKTYGVDWVRMFCSRHGIEGGSNLHYGSFPGAHGERRIMFGFDDAQIRSDTGGSTIRKVELRMRNTDSWGYAGITVRFGAHNKSSPPSSFSQNRSGIWSNDWPESGWGGGADKWRNSTTWIGRALRDNSIKGLTIDQPGGVTSYGEMDANSLSLRITYTK